MCLGRSGGPWDPKLYVDYVSGKPLEIQMYVYYVSVGEFRGLWWLNPKRQLFGRMLALRPEGGIMYIARRVLAGLDKPNDSRIIDMPPPTIPWRGAPYNDGQAERAGQASNPKP